MAKAKSDDRPPVPGGYPDTKIDGPVERRGSLYPESTDAPVNVPPQVETDEADAVEEEES